MKCAVCGDSVWDKFSNGLCPRCLGEWQQRVLGVDDPDLIGECDTCDAKYDVSSRDGRCGDCGECSTHCPHV